MLQRAEWKPFSSWWETALIEAIAIKYSQTGKSQSCKMHLEGLRAEGGKASLALVTGTMWPQGFAVCGGERIIMTDILSTKVKLLLFLNACHVLHSWEFQKCLKLLFLVDSSEHLKICYHRNQSIIYLKIRFIQRPIGINYAIFFQTSCCDWNFGMEYFDSHQRNNPLIINFIF